MSTHTPTPWLVFDTGEGLGIYGPKERYIGELNTADEDDRANGARIVASVNACAELADPVAALAWLRGYVRALCVSDDARLRTTGKSIVVELFPELADELGVRS